MNQEGVKWQTIQQAHWFLSLHQYYKSVLVWRSAHPSSENLQRDLRLAAHRRLHVYRSCNLVLPSEGQAAAPRTHQRRDITLLHSRYEKAASLNLPAAIDRQSSLHVASRACIVPAAGNRVTVTAGYSDSNIVLCTQLLSTRISGAWRTRPRAGC